MEDVFQCIGCWGTKHAFLWSKHGEGGKGDDEVGEREEPAHGESLCHVEPDFVLRQWEFTEGIKRRCNMLKILIWKWCPE